MGENVPIFDIDLDALSANGKALKFMVGETGMAFGFEYYKMGKLLRVVMIVEDRKVQENGKALEIEYSGLDYTDLIFSLIKDVSGDNIDTINPDANSDHYKFIKLKKLTQEVSKNENKIPSNKVSIEKPWWKFW